MASFGSTAPSGSLQGGYQPAQRPSFVEMEHERNVLENEPGPVVLAYDPSVRRRLHWLTCLGCYGESGRISYREDNRVVITQR